MALLGDASQIDLPHLTDDFLMEMIGRRVVSAEDKAGPAQVGTLLSMEAQAVQVALERHGGNISATAAALGVSRATVYRKIKYYGLGGRKS
jgi:transcriptional regulator of acetoin/glycerol metabolism